jgi:WD40 repeat protein
MGKRIIASLAIVLTGALLGCQEPHNIRMRFAAMVPGSPEQLVGVDANHRILLCDPETQDVIRVLGSHRGPVRELRVSPEGDYVATVGTAGDCRVWNTASAAAAPLVASVPGGGDDRGAVAFLDDGAHIACGGTGVVDVISLRDGTLVRRIPDRGQDILYEGSDFQALAKTLKEARVLSLDARPGGRHLLVGTDCGAMEIDYLRCRIMWRQKERVGQVATLVRYLPDGEQFVVQDDSGRLTLYAGHKSVWSTRPGESGPGGRGLVGVTAAEFTNDSAYLAALGSDGRFRVLRLSDQKVVQELAPGKLDTAGLALSPGRASVWVGSQGNVERFTRIALPQEMTTPKLTIE